MAEPARSFLNAATPRIFSIAAGRPFLTDLAAGLADATGGDPVALADMRIFAPTRRAVRALGEAFQKSAMERGVRAVLLPRIEALGDIDDDAGLFRGDTEAEISLPPAVSAMERKLTLAQLVAAKDRAFAGQENWPAALCAAGELAKLLDSFYTEEIPFDKLRDVVPERFAAHWNESLTFLDIVTKAWPAHLAAIGKLDPADRRVRLINAKRAQWSAEPPNYPVIIAGTTGSAPSVAQLMKTVASFEKGAIVLPGLDTDLAAEKGWAEIDDPHPQAGLKALLEEIAYAAPKVRSWPVGEAHNPRRSLISIALRPANATDDWRALVQEAARDDPHLKSATKNLTLIDAADEEEEATAIALMMRETLEAPDATAMLVTPDRDLSRRVAAKMRRWDVMIDDSAGIPFHNSPCGLYLRLVAEWLHDRADPVKLMAMARHPLCRFSLDDTEKAQRVNQLDRALRGLAPGKPGAAGVRERAAQSGRAEALAPICDALERAERFQPSTSNATFQDVFSAHIACAEALAARPNEPGTAALWAGEDGETGAALMADLKPAVNAVAAPGAQYPEIFAQLISAATVRRRTPAHPRLSILGPLEARLQSADLVILGGLNEGVWPSEAAVDPFLSRPMRKDIGLPSPERRIGLAAHDFAQLASSRRVALTRAARAGGKPTKPSRWLLRLRNILTGGDAIKHTDQTAKYAHLAFLLNKPADVRPAAAPNFAPPVEARPKSLFVTRIGALLRDPYGVYANQILKLRKLDALGEDFDARHLGSLFHKVFEEFAKQYPSFSPDNAESILTTLFDETAPQFGYTRKEDAFWRAHVTDTLRWFEAFHASSLEAGPTVFVETEGAWTHEIAGAPFTLKARADRIDLQPDGFVDIYDYKSKSIPSLKQIKSDFSPQLPLTALIAREGGFDGINARGVKSFQYLRFLLRKDKDKENTLSAEDAEAEKAVNDARDGFEKIIAHYADPDTAYLSQPRAEFVDVYGDYDQLARRREWRNEEDGPSDPV
ncbi:MAG: double-strand break repair protein AddB [Pseudomonadota bacterium]